MPTALTGRLLVPLDGSEFAEQALAYALAMETTDTQIVLAQVLPHPEARYQASGQLQAPIEAVLDTEMAAARAELHRRAAAWGLPAERVQIEVRVGDPAENLLDIAATHGCTLVLMASHGRGAVGRWRFGSVADRLARSVTIPTLIVRPGTTVVEPGTAASMTRIVVPLDGSPRAEQALPVAGALAAQLRVPVHLVRVAAEPDTPVVPIVGAPVLSGLRGQAEADAIDAARGYLEEVADHPALVGVKTTTDVIAGPPAPRLLEIAVPTDLVVLTSRGRGGAARWLLGSVADKLVRAAAAPVCLVPNIPRPASDKVDEEVPAAQVRELLMKDVYSPREAARVVGTDVATICQAAYKGELPARILNRDVVSIRRQDLVAWLNRR